MKKRNIIFILLSLLLNLFSIHSFGQGQTNPGDSLDSELNDMNSLDIIKSNRLQYVPFRAVEGVALTSPNTYYLKFDRLFVDGLEATGDNIFVEGMQIADGKDFPFRSIAEYHHYRLNQPIEYGNVAGSMIELKTPVYADKFHFDLDGYTTLNKDLKNNVVELNLGGPIRFSKKNKNKFAPIFYLTSNYSFTNDPFPSSEDKYRVTTETQDFLTENPLRPSNLYYSSTFLNAEFLEQSEIEEVKVHQGAERNALNSFLKLMFPITKNINLSLGSYAKIDNGSAFVFDNALLNSHNNPETYFQNFDNYMNFDHRIDINEDLSINYNVNFQYSNYYFRQQDARHKDRYFEYGYLGKYKTYKTPVYQFVDEIEINGEVYENVYVLTSLDYDTAYTFQNLNYNPESARFTEQIYELFPGNNGHWQNSDQLQLNGGLLNGQNPPDVYGNPYNSLWNSQGNISPYSLNSSAGNYSYVAGFGNRQQEKYRGTFKIDVNYKAHNFFAGFEYLQKTERSYSIDPMALWGRMRGLTNYHIQELDLGNPQIGNDTINFYRQYNEQIQFEFDKNLRQKLGLQVDGLDFILTDSYDMINNTIDYYDKDGMMHTIYAGDNFFTLDMFSPLELLNDGQYVVNYMGYDYTGEKLKGKQGKYDFYENYTIDAYRPSYFSAYLGDQFSWKIFDVSLGLRIDNFNANQPVLKDKYSLYEVLTVGESGWSHPSNMGDDYAVYVNNVYNPTQVMGYRDGDTWYDANGNNIDNPELLDAGSGISPYFKLPFFPIWSNSWSPDRSFEDYKPVTYLLPQVNIEAKTKYGNVYANYNSFSQNPVFKNYFRPDVYLFFNNVFGVIDNPALKPARYDKVSVGLKPRYKNFFADIGYLGVLAKNYYYFERIAGAFPKDYTTILNKEETIPNHNFVISLNYFSPKSFGIGASSSLTKSFITDENRFYMNISDLVINTHLTFNFGYGKDFILPHNEVTEAIFGNFGVSVYHQFRTGTKLPLNTNTDQLYFYSPNFDIFNFRIEKGFYIKPAGITASFYFLIENFFNKQNLFYIDPVTGKPDDDGYLSAPEWQNEINSQTNPETYRMLYQYKLVNPAYYDTPRIFRLGLIVKM